MQCHFCGTPLAPLRRLDDGDFCSDSHRILYETDARAPLIARSAGQPPISSAAPRTGLRGARLTPFAPSVAVVTPHVEFGWATLAPPAAGSLGRMDAPLPLAPARVAPAVEISQARSQAPGFPSCKIQPTAPRDFGKVAPRSCRPLIAGVRRSREIWQAAPPALKLFTAALSMAVALVMFAWIPKTRMVESDSLVARQLVSLKKNILNRAAVDFADDFRTGLEDWQSRSKPGAGWSYDAAGFVHPGPLALYRPTLDLSDYQFEFLGQVDQKSLGFVFRAADLDNYYAARFVIVKPGPLPLVKLVRYAVIRGREGPHMERPLPIPVRADMLYRVRLEARGSDFTLIIQGRVVDTWSDGRLPKGGVGFFCGRGERARVRWVEVSHQYDTLGRLCAYLAPYGGQMRNWN
jgi:hypothetical protein